MSAYYTAFVKSLPISFEDLNVAIQDFGIPLVINSTGRFDERIEGISVELESIPIWIDVSVTPLSSLSETLQKAAPSDSTFAISFRYSSSWIEFSCILGISAALIKNENAKIYNDFSPNAGLVSLEEIMDLFHNGFKIEKECFKLAMKTGQEVLEPLGLSRVNENDWIDDHGWWISTITIPFNLGNKVSLEAGACWLWHRKDYFSYDIGPFLFQSFDKYKSPAHFELEATKQFKKASEQVSKLSKEFSDFRSVAKHLTEKKGNDFWGNFNAGIALGLAGNIDLAKEHLIRVVSSAPTNNSEWVTKACSEASYLSNLLSDKSAFQEEVLDRIRFHRKALKLKETDIQFDT